MRSQGGVAASTSHAASELCRACGLTWRSLACQIVSGSGGNESRKMQFHPSVAAHKLARAARAA